MSDPTFLQMRSILEAELPTNRALPVMGASPTDFAYAYGVEVGYRNCLAVLAALAEPAAALSEVSADFSQHNQA